MQVGSARQQSRRQTHGHHRQKFGQCCLLHQFSSRVSSQQNLKLTPGLFPLPTPLFNPSLGRRQVYLSQPKIQCWPNTQFVPQPHLPGCRPNQGHVGPRIILLLPGFSEAQPCLHRLGSQRMARGRKIRASRFRISHRCQLPRTNATPQIQFP